ncbi:MAG: nucleotidyltransferase substrate binding protein [Bacteroidales bacterium]|nr:nucleotidyltransferase substrate binding protein [Bacteroidales bacterium]
MENTLPRWEQKLSSYRKALSRLAEVVNVMKIRQLNDFESDGLIQRFEFTFELAWKLMKSYAEYQGTDKELMGSRDAIRWAFENKLIKDSDVWMEMIKRRNDTSHTYDENTAADVVIRVKDAYFQAFVCFYNKMKSLSSQKIEDLFTQMGE